MVSAFYSLVDIICCVFQEEMDIKVLTFQNKKLVERIEQRRRAEEDLKKRIEQLEQRQTTDDAVLCIVNRYWNQVSVISARKNKQTNLLFVNIQCNYK